MAVTGLHSITFCRGWKARAQGHRAQQSISTLRDFKSFRRSQVTQQDQTSQAPTTQTRYQCTDTHSCRRRTPPPVLSVCNFTHLHLSTHMQVRFRYNRTQASLPSYQQSENNLQPPPRVLTQISNPSAVYLKRLSITPQYKSSYVALTNCPKPFTGLEWGRGGRHKRLPHRHTALLASKSIPATRREP